MEKGQATVDLPDPLDPADVLGTPASDGPGAPASDELMAQLAGDEIDRLLAEAEEDRGGGAGASPAVNSGERSDARASDVPLLVPLPAEDAVDAVQQASAAITEEAVASLDAELEDLFKQIQTDPQSAKSIEPTRVDAPVDPLDPVAPAGVEEPQEPVDVAQSNTPITSHAPVEQASAPSTPAVAPVLSAPVLSAHPVGAPSSPFSEQVELKLDELPAVPLRRSLLGRVLIKPLEWVNFPLADADASIRITIGKIAILTLFNAVAVIVYVLVFRGR